MSPESPQDSDQHPGATSSTPNVAPDKDGPVTPPPPSNYTVLETETRTGDSVAPIVNLTGSLGPNPVPSPRFELSKWSLTNLGLCAAFGVAYLSHTRFRRYNPRRLPTFTSLTLGELYGSSGMIALVLSDMTRHSVRASLDRDLFTVHAAAAAIQATVLPAKLADARATGKWDKLDDVEAMERLPSHTSLLDRLLWRYRLAWGGAVPFSLAADIIVTNAETHVKQGGKLPAGLTYTDLLVLIHHTANILFDAENPSAEKAFSDRCYWGLLAMTSFAMLARWKGLWYLALPLNLAQRVMFHGLWMFPAATVHQLLRYPSTLLDKHAAAELLCIVIPGLRETVDEKMRNHVTVNEL
ncbi:hypothetical protein C2E23DRAFT_854133 [Lenzites betulinus]|nr:hypothetical protein C2E23DRAFT_854133 [Lenzites betulinus]